MASSSNQNPGCLTVVLRALGVRGLSSEPEQLPYRLRDDFLSPAELSFYHVLVSAVGEKAAVMTKVRLADIFHVLRIKENFSYHNRISQQHVDFLVCDSKTMRPLAGIELDDSSHDRAGRQRRDEFKDRVFATAKLPLLRVKAGRTYRTADIEALLRPILTERSQSDSPFKEKAKSGQLQASSTAKQERVQPPMCPKCGAPMVRRVVKQGAHKGKQFYGCRNYPKCRGVLPITTKS